MILVRLKGGLGNQLFQYAFGRMLSIEYSDDLVLDLSWYEGDLAKRFERTYELDEYNIKAKIATREQITDAAERIATGQKTWFGRQLWELIEENPLSGFEPEYCKKKADNVILEGYWQSEKYFSPISEYLYQEFTLREGVNEDARKLIQEFDEVESISIHIRRGDYLNKAKEFHGVLSTSYYFKAAGYFKNRFPEAHYYVFSDDPEWCKQNLDFLDYQKIISNQNQFRQRSPAEELFLMSACKHNIIANSSFSWWGGWLNQYKNKDVIAPNQWFSGRTQPIDLIPDNWVMIDNDFQP